MNSNKQLLAAGVGTAVIGLVCNNNAMWQSSDGAEQTGLACAAQVSFDKIFQSNIRF